jgi:hypothetical protein
MRKADLTAAKWLKSSYSSANGQCVEVAALYGSVALRDSKDPYGPALLFGIGEFTAFLHMVKTPNDGYPSAVSG